MAPKLAFGGERNQEMGEMMRKIIKLPSNSLHEECSRCCFLEAYYSSNLVYASEGVGDNIVHCCLGETASAGYGGAKNGCDILEKLLELLEEEELDQALLHVSKKTARTPLVLKHLNGNGKIKRDVLENMILRTKGQFVYPTDSQCAMAALEIAFEKGEKDIIRRVSKEKTEYKNVRYTDNGISDVWYQTAMCNIAPEVIQRAKEFLQKLKIKQ